MEELQQDASVLMTESQRCLVQIVEGWIGASLLERADELRKFIARDIDDPRYELNAHISDCGLFALAVWHAAGVHHQLCDAKYVPGVAIQWLVHIAHDLQAIRYPQRDGLPVPGALMQYYSPRPSHNDHVEFCLSLPNADGLAEHAGGGRPECEIGSSTSDIRWSSARPLQCWIDPDALLDFDAPAETAP
jgi:hypothetical protein